MKCDLCGVATAHLYIARDPIIRSTLVGSYCQRATCQSTVVLSLERAMLEAAAAFAMPKAPGYMNEYGDSVGRRGPKPKPSSPRIPKPPRETWQEKWRREHKQGVA